MMETKKDVYLENVDQLLKLVNEAKELGYDIGFVEMADIVRFDLNNIDKMDMIDLEMVLSINKTYENNKQTFRNMLDNNSIVKKTI